MTYHFCTKACRQLWWEDRDNLNHTTLVERFLLGEIQPMDLSGALGYMGLTPEVMGDDAHNYAWAKSFAASGTPAPVAGE
jgi:toluene monooxygenase system protein A